MQSMLSQLNFVDFNLYHYGLGPFTCIIKSIKEKPTEPPSLLWPRPFSEHVHPFSINVCIYFNGQNACVQLLSTDPSARYDQQRMCHRLQQQEPSPR